METTDTVVVGLRALAFIAVVQAAGIAVYCALFLARIERTRALLLSVTCAGSLAAIVLVVLHHAAEPARMTASFSGIWDGGLQSILLQSDAGAARALRVLGLAIIAWGAISKSSLRGNLMLIGAVLALFSFTLMGHTASHPFRWLLAATLVLHLLVAAFWFGALLVFVLTANRERPSLYAALARDFSMIAGWAVPTIPLAGVVMAVVLMPDLASLTTPYGRLLIAKATGFVLLMLIAAWNKLRLVPGLIGESPRVLAQFRRAVLIEWIVVALILAVTATMTGLFGPE